jgi:hypothetical protein
MTANLRAEGARRLQGKRFYGNLLNRCNTALFADVVSSHSSQTSEMTAWRHQKICVRFVSLEAIAKAFAGSENNNHEVALALTTTL